MMFWTRLGSSVVLVVLALIFLISGGPVLGAVCLLLSLTAYYELIKACHVEKDGKATLLEIMGGCGIVLYGAAMMLSKNFLWGIGAIVLMFLAVMFVYVFHFPKYHADQVMTAFFCAFYPGVLFQFIYLTRELSWGKYLVWLIFISSWICDTCAYLTGMAIGKHKLAPVLSPKKSIEGAIGGVVGSALVGALFAWLFLIPVILAHLPVFAVDQAVVAVQDAHDLHIITHPGIQCLCHAANGCVQARAVAAGGQDANTFFHLTNPSFPLDLSRRRAGDIWYYKSIPKGEMCQEKIL